MTNDERAIRQLVDDWMNATKAGDTETVLTLMSDDVLFMVPGQEPFGKEAFAATSRSMKNVSVDGTAEILEIYVSNDWAWMRSRIKVSITPAHGEAMKRSGYTLTLLRKQPDGRWVITRDANLVMPDAD